MPPVTRRSTGAVKKITYHQDSDDSDASSVDIKISRRTRKKGTRNSEDSDFEMRSASEASSSSSSESDTVVEDESVDSEVPSDAPSEDNEVSKSSFGGVSWKAVHKLPMFPMGLFRLSSEELVESSISRLVAFRDWKSALKSYLETSVYSSTTEAEKINLVLSFLDIKELPAVSSFFRYSLRGVRRDVITDYFARLQTLAREVLSHLPVQNDDHEYDDEEFDPEYDSEVPRGVQNQLKGGNSGGNNYVVPTFSYQKPELHENMNLKRADPNVIILNHYDVSKGAYVSPTLKRPKSASWSTRNLRENGLPATLRGTDRDYKQPTFDTQNSVGSLKARFDEPSKSYVLQVEDTEDRTLPTNFYDSFSGYRSEIHGDPFGSSKRRETGSSLSANFKLSGAVRPSSAGGTKRSSFGKKVGAKTNRKAGAGKAKKHQGALGKKRSAEDDMTDDAILDLLDKLG